MSKSVEETRRELFEHECVQYRQYLKRNKDGTYNEEWVESCWQGFNAAFDLIEIELPDSCKMSTEELDEGYNAGYLKWEIVEAIKALNLGLKIK